MSTSVSLISRLLLDLAAVNLVRQLAKTSSALLLQHLLLLSRGLLSLVLHMLNLTLTLNALALLLEGLEGGLGRLLYDLLLV